MTRERKTKIFVSYSRHDEDLVKPLASFVGLGRDEIVFLDVNSLKPGDDWKERIESAIREASIFVVCWCCKCKNSTFVAHEIEIALESKGKSIIPVLFCSSPLPASLKRHQWIDMRGKVSHSCGTHDESNIDELSGKVMGNLLSNSLVLVGIATLNPIILLAAIAQRFHSHKTIEYFVRLSDERKAANPK